MSVVIETTLGDVTVDLYLEDRPRACLNFLKLCKMKYYNFNLFHTISRGFIAQTGDPTGTRKGGQSIFGVIDGASKRYFEAENEPRIKHTRPGLISFVGGDDNMLGSQFFLTLGEDLTYLDEKHCVFGEVVEGVDVLEAINEVICDNEDRPYQDVRITHTVLIDDPYPDPKHIKVPSRSPSPSAARLAGGRIAPDEEIDETSGRSNHEIAEMQAEREAKARATILEMVGDIPDAEMAPPENVLFVCKLNPVTTDDDLEIIFSRFGKIKSCEVIRDRKSGDSLQYAFIEFEEQKSCEDAYFKMGNVLIDDRRIHVDFSQSVSKVKWLGKGRGVTHYDETGNKRRTDANNDIGKGNYKVKNGAKNEHAVRGEKRRSKSPIRRRRRSRSPVEVDSRRNRRLSKSPRRMKSSSHSPRRRRASPASDRHSRNRYSPERERKKVSQFQAKTRIKSRSPIYYNRRRSSSPSVSLQRNDTRLSYRRRSKSPRTSSGGNYSSHRRSRHRSSSIGKSRNTTPPSSHVKKSVSPKRTKRERSKSLETYKHKKRDISSRGTEKPAEDTNRSRRESKSPSIDESGIQLRNSRERGPSKMSRSPKAKSPALPRDAHSSTQRSSSSMSKKDVPASPNSSKIEKHGKDRTSQEIHKPEDKNKPQAKIPKASLQKNKRPQAGNSSDSPETGDEKEIPRKKKSKKNIKSSSTSSSSQNDSSSSSEEEKLKIKAKKRKDKNIKIKKIKKTKKTKKKSSRESSSSGSGSSSSETSSSSSSSSSESNERSKRKKKKSKMKRTKFGSESN